MDTVDLRLLLLADDVAALQLPDGDHLARLELLRLILGTVETLAGEAEAAAIADGMSYATVARAVGSSRQAVWKRHSRRGWPPPADL
jgi:hypothetical protein